jgi:pyruvate/2-oxoglutarate dehydrogenase complex dihydrolipoamide acyltransferase (E2) component
MQESYKVFQNLDPTNATGTLESLNQMIAQGSEKAEEIKEKYIEKGGIIDLSSQFSDLITSGVLDAISEDIAKLSDEAGNIDVSATRKLIDENK